MALLRGLDTPTGVLTPERASGQPGLGVARECPVAVNWGRWGKRQWPCGLVPSEPQEAQGLCSISPAGATLTDPQKAPRASLPSPAAKHTRPGDSGAGGEMLPTRGPFPREAAADDGRSASSTQTLAATPGAAGGHAQEPRGGRCAGLEASEQDPDSVAVSAAG